MARGHRNRRIGDTEREEAVELLQEHHVEGRLDVVEFDRRMSKALAARTLPELHALFTDMPGPRPGLFSDPKSLKRHPVLYVPRKPRGRQEQAAAVRPWYANWLLLPAAVAVAALSFLHWSAIIWIALVWLVVGYPLVARRRPEPEAAPKRIRRKKGVRVHAILTDWEVARVEEELLAGRRTAAIQMFRNFTGADFNTAQRDIELLRRQIEAGSGEDD